MSQNISLARPHNLACNKGRYPLFFKCGAPKYLPQIPRQAVSYEVQPLQRYPLLIVLPDKEQVKKYISAGHVIPHNTCVQRWMINYENTKPYLKIYFFWPFNNTQTSVHLSPCKKKCAWATYFHFELIVWKGTQSKINSFFKCSCFNLLNTLMLLKI